MEPQNHPDPIAEAASHGIQRAIQVASSAATGAQVLVYLQQERTRTRARTDERDRRAHAAQIRAGQAAARARLAGIGNWLPKAGLGQAARAWGLSMPYADPATPWHDPSAETTMRRAEERLRVLHPTAMARYDRLRSDGAAPAEAMRQAAPLFGYPPRAHNPPYTPPPRSLTAARPATPARPDAGPVQARAAQPWQQDFPLPIDHVLAATAGTDNAVRSRPEPAVPSPAAARGARAGGLS